MPDTSPALPTWAQGLPDAPFNFREWPGARLAEHRPGYARLTLPVLQGYVNRGGRLHGGFFFTVADFASGTAVMTYGHRTTTVTGSMDFLAPGLGCTELTAEATVTKHGKTLSTVEATIRDQTGRLLASGHFTFFNFDAPLTGTLEERFSF